MQYIFYLNSHSPLNTLAVGSQLTPESIDTNVGSQPRREYMGEDGDGPQQLPHNGYLLQLF
jgi:hypothetical protein